MRVMSMAACGALLVACAAQDSSRNPQTTSPVDFATVAPGYVSTARLDGRRLYGPDGEVDRFDDGWRGRWRSQIVDLRLEEGGRIRGIVGDAPVDLHVKEKDDGFDVRGLYAGVLGNLTVTSLEIDGTVGRHGIHATRDSAESRSYRAVLSHDGAVTSAPRAATRFAVPEGFDQRSPRERAVLLAIVLGT